MKKNLLFIVLGLFVLLSSCVKDREVFIPDDGINYKSNILGIVVDESNLPAEGASVTYNGITKTTDKNGIYTFNNVDVSSKHSFLKIRKAGYFEASRAFNTQKPANIQLRNILMTKDFSNSFNASSGGVIEANGYKITFPANAIIIESTGAPYTGQVKVAVKYLDPSLYSTFFQMPGNLSGLSAKNEVSKLATYGMLAVELQSTSGEKLQIKTGSQAEISANIPKDYLTSAPATIPLWYYDENLGYWKEEGTAQLVNNSYVGKVSHFSYWNYDSSLPSINVSGKVVDANGNPLVCDISFTTPGYSGGHGINNSDGTFSGPIGKDVQLTLNIYAVQGNCIGILYTAQVGPFSTDVVLPDITINSTTQDVFSCNGTFKDCSGNLVQNGYMKVVEAGSYYYPFYYPIINGQASGSFTTCANPINAVVTAVNLDEIKESTPINLTGAGPHDLKEVSVCATEPDHISIVCTNLGINELHTEFGFIDSVGEIIMYVNYLAPSKIESFTIVYDDKDPDKYAPGTFTPSGAACYFIGPSEVYYYDSGTVTITQGGAKGDILIGTYDLYLKIQGTTNIEHFTGEFKWHIK